MLGFVVMLCATFIGFVSEIRPLGPDSLDRGYDDALENQTLSLVNGAIPVKASDGAAPVAPGSKGDPKAPAIEAAVACVDASPSANLHARTAGGGHVE